MGAVSLLEDIEERFWETADRAAQGPRRPKEPISSARSVCKIVPMRSPVGIAPVITGQEKTYFDRIRKAAAVLHGSHNSTTVTEAELALKIAIRQYANFVIRRSRTENFDLKSLQSLNYLNDLFKANLSAARLVIEEFESLSRYLDGDEQWLFAEIESAALKHGKQLELSRRGRPNLCALKTSQKALNQSIWLYAEFLIRVPSQTRQGSFRKLERLITAKNWIGPIVQEQLENLLRTHRK